MRLTVDHTTRYAFSGPVPHGLQRLRLTPKVTAGQHVIDWTITCEGAVRQVEYDDHNHNRVTLIAFEPGVREIVLRAGGTVETADSNGIIGAHAGYLPLWHFLQPTALTRAGPRVRALLGQVEPMADPVARLHAISQAVLGAVAYRAGFTDVTTGAEAVLAARQGVCQDHAHVFIAALRVIGVPARYVGGYLLMDDSTDQSAGHAWAEAHVTGLGWVGFDISNGISPDARYVRVSTGRDYREAAPVTGIRFGGVPEKMQVALAVARQHMEQ